MHMTTIDYHLLITFKFFMKNQDHFFYLIVHIVRPRNSTILVMLFMLTGRFITRQAQLLTQLHLPELLFLSPHRLYTSSWCLTSSRICTLIHLIFQETSSSTRSAVALLGLLLDNRFLTYNGHRFLEINLLQCSAHCSWIGCCPVLICGLVLSKFWVFSYD